MEIKEYTLSEEALVALMMTLQKSLLEQSDIVPILKGLKFAVGGEELLVLNPPVVRFGLEEEEGLEWAGND